MIVKDKLFMIDNILIIVEDIEAVVARLRAYGSRSSVKCCNTEDESTGLHP